MAIQDQDVQWREVRQAWIESVFVSIHHFAARDSEQLIKHGDHLEFYLFPAAIQKVTRKRKAKKTYSAIQNMMVPIFIVSSKNLIGDRGLEFSKPNQTKEEGVPSKGFFDRRGRLLRMVSEESERINDKVTLNSTQKTIISSVARRKFCLAIAR